MLQQNHSNCIDIQCNYNEKQMNSAEKHCKLTQTLQQNHSNCIETQCNYNEKQMNSADKTLQTHSDITTKSPTTQKNKKEIVSAISLSPEGNFDIDAGDGGREIPQIPKISTKKQTN